MADVLSPRGGSAAKSIGQGIAGWHEVGNAQVIHAGKQAGAVRSDQPCTRYDRPPSPGLGQARPLQFLEDRRQRRLELLRVGDLRATITVGCRRV
jgi:hypothetical protein